MRIPKQIKAFGFVYPIIQRKNLRDKSGRWLGLINHKKGWIKIEKDAHQGRKEESLFHELIHFVNMEKLIRMREKQVEDLSTGLYTILKDNNLLK